MKKILKRILAIWLTVVIALGSTTLAGFVGVDLPSFSKLFETKAKAIEVSDLPEDFELTHYNVSKIFSDSNNSGGSLKTYSENFINLSLAKKVYNAAAEDADFVASVEAWEAIRLVSNPSNLAEYLKYQQQYEEAIFAVLFSALKNEKFEEFSYSNGISKITSLIKKIITSGKNAELLDKTSLDGTERKELIDTAFAFLTEGKDIDSKWSAFGDSLEIGNKFLKFTENVASAINIINSVSMYVSMLDTGAEVLSYLEALKSKAPNSAFGGAVQTVINTISHDWLGVVEKTIIDSGFVFCMPAVEKLIDYAWTGCSAMCPFLGGMTIGEAAGTVACNLLFATEDTIEQYEYLKIITQLETAACALYDGYFNSCKSSVNSENAAMLMFACDFSHALFSEATGASVEMMNILCNKGIVNTVVNIFNNKYKQTFDEFEETSNVLLNAEKNVYNMIKSFWKNSIEEDYPEFFTVLEEENISPKYIEEVNIEKDEAVFCVGDAMYFKWTLSPIDYEGEIGLKSDNEAVIKSSEPMGILPLALEENIGTANVTIYSIDNPEICDTIKITVIGEDDEGTTEAEQNIVSGKCGDNLTWTLNKNTGRMIISGTGEMADYYEHTHIPPWKFYSNSNYIKNITICNGATSIGEYAFYHLDNLERVMVGESITSIGNSAFHGCAKLNVINIPGSVTIMGNNALAYCANLKNVTISDGVISISDGMFRSCDSLVTIEIPNSIITIGDEAFAGCEKLTNLTIPDSVTTIGDYAFRGCSKLIGFIIPDGVRIIGRHAFHGCDSFTSVTVGNGLTTIEEGAFYNCEALEKVIIGDGVITVDNFAFAYCHNLISVEFGEKVKTIGDNVFENCINLNNVSLPLSLTTIGHEAFHVYYDDLKDVYYSGSEEQWKKISIGPGNHKLTNATIHFNYNANSHVHTISDWQIVLEPTTETTGKKIKKCTICGTTVAEEIIAKLPKEPVKDSSVVKTPTTSTVSYGDSIILHVDPSKIPQGGHVEWTASNGNFSYSVSADGTTCTISPLSSGDTTFTATIYDASGNAVSTDEQTMTSKAGFFQKIIAFFKKLFGATKIIPQIIKM